MAKKLVLVEQFFDLFFPRKCVGCGAEGVWVCEGCARDLVVGARIIHEQNVSTLYSLESRCIREAVHSLKYNGVFELAPRLVEITKSWCRPEELFEGGSVLVPVPVSRRRLSQRGYNQAESLAEALGDWAGLPVYGDLLAKKETKTQVGKGVDERLSQLSEAFYIRDGVASLADRPVVVIDDVYTTGSTVRTVCNVLTQAGVKHVSAVVLARA